MNTTGISKVIAYVDGFNLYFGLKESKWKNLYWLNVAALCSNLLKPDQELVAVKYFTSRISGAHPLDSAERASQREMSRKRQALYLEVLACQPKLEIVEGKFLPKVNLVCRKCGASFHTFEEKMTDVNIATHMLGDAYEDKFDKALLISADSDLTPPIRTLVKRFPGKRIVVAFPPNRWSNDLKTAASAYFQIAHSILAKSQLPDQVSLPNGFTALRPPEWA